MNKKKYDKWFDEYIKDVNLENIEWVLFNQIELDEFYMKNYLDTDYWRFVHDGDRCDPKPFGMCYLPLTHVHITPNQKYILGIVDNNKGTKTIVAAIIFTDNYYIFTNQKNPMLCISTVEVNKFFRKKGLLKQLVNAFVSNINLEQHILSTPESLEGHECHVFDTIYKTLIDVGFTKTFVIDDCELRYNTEYRDIILQESLLLKKNM